MAMISLNLAIVNLLPFPILDGGVILLLAIEGIMRHDLKPQIKERVYQGAFVILVLLFMLLIFNDISKLSLFAHAKS
jgi:regulator of sigma E protease